MRTFLIWAATIGIGLYALQLLVFGARRAGGSRGIRRSQRSAGGMYGQLNSVTGRVVPPRLGLSFWFLLLVCAAVLVKIWWL
jgi:hypothetical protein